MDYATEQALIADGFSFTPNARPGVDELVYEKIVDGVRVHFAVDVDGNVAPWNSNATVAVPVVEAVVPEVVAPVEEAPVVEPVEPATETSPEGNA